MTAILAVSISFGFSSLRYHSFSTIRVLSRSTSFVQSWSSQSTLPAFSACLVGKTSSDSITDPEATSATLRLVGVLLSEMVSPFKSYEQVFHSSDAPGCALILTPDSYPRSCI